MIYQPYYLEKFEIYDIFYKNKNLCIVCPGGEISKNNLKPCINMFFENNRIPCIWKGKVHIYKLNCEYNEYITLTIEDEIINNIKVTLYPVLKDELILTTMVKNEDNYIVQWINYNLMIGFTKIIIYDNKDSPDTRYHSIETTNNLEKILKKYIENDEVILINWKYPKWLYNCIAGQFTQQNHCLYAFREAKYMAFNDIDEYINLTNYPDMSLNVNKVLDKVINNTAGVRIWGKYFQSNGMNVEKYEFLKVTDYYVSRMWNPNNMALKDELLFRDCNSPKCIVVPERTYNVGTHGFMGQGIYKGYDMKTLDLLYFNHYFFLNKKMKGRDGFECITKDDSLVKFYDILTKSNI